MRDALGAVYSEMHRAQRFVELEMHARRALAHDPDSLVFRRFLLAALVAQRRFDDAVELGTSWLARASDASTAVWTACALIGKDRVSDAFDHLERHATALIGSTDLLQLADAAIENAVQSRNLDATLRRLEPWLGGDLIAGLPIMAPIAAEIARWFVATGDFPKAVHFVRLARLRGLSDSGLRGDPDLRPLRGFPGFERLFARDDRDDDPEPGGGDDGPLNI